MSKIPTTKYYYHTLPKWAQSHISLLEMRLQEAYDEIEATRGTERTAVYSGRSYRIETTDLPIYLPEDRPIQFQLENKRIEVRRVDDHHLQFRADNGALVLVPRFANEIEVR